MTSPEDSFAGVALSSVSLSPGAKRFLRATGFSRLSELQHVKAMELSQQLNMDPKQTLTYLSEIRAFFGSGNNPAFLKANPLVVSSALQLWNHTSNSTNHIITFCQPLDQILGGGVPVGELTEFSGAPGAGKTQLCIQLAMDVVIPAVFGGMDGEAVYIDTEGSFAVERAVEMAEALLKHLRSIARTTRKTGDAEMAEAQFAALAQFQSAEDVLRHVHYCRVHDFAEQIGMAKSLEEFFTAHPRVKLVVVDSIAFHFRHGFEDMAVRTRALNAHAQVLNTVASRHRVAVVVSNQMTTKIGAGAEGHHLVPALGESWSHAVTNRILLSATTQLVDCTRYLSSSSNNPANQQRLAAQYKQVAVRRAELVKSPSREQQSAQYVVVRQGIRKLPRGAEPWVPTACAQGVVDPKRRRLA